MARTARGGGEDQKNKNQSAPVRPESKGEKGRRGTAEALKRRGEGGESVKTSVTVAADGTGEWRIAAKRQAGGRKGDTQKKKSAKEWSVKRKTNCKRPGEGKEATKNGEESSGEEDASKRRRGQCDRNKESRERRRKKKLNSQCEEGRPRGRKQKRPRKRDWK